MSTGIVYLHKRVNAYFKTRRVIFLFMKQSPHIFNIHVKPRLLGVEIWSSQRNALGEYALALLWRWFFLRVSHQDKTVASGKGLVEKGQKLQLHAEVVKGNYIWVETKELDEAQITNLCKCCSAAPCNGGSCGISPCAPRGSCAACNSAHNKHICEVFQLHKQTNKLEYSYNM